MNAGPACALGRDAGNSSGKPKGGDTLSLLRSILSQIARRAASDPEFRAKAGSFARDEVVPRVSAARDELTDLAKKASPREDPRGFLRLLGRRVAEINKRDPEKT